MTAARVTAPFTVEVIFVDGTSRTIDLHPFLNGPVFEPLKDPAYFSLVEVDAELGVITWPNGADFSPEFLYSGGDHVLAARGDAS